MITPINVIEQLYLMLNEYRAQVKVLIEKKDAWSDPRYRKINHPKIMSEINLIRLRIDALEVAISSLIKPLSPVKE